MKKLNIYLCKKTVESFEDCLKPITEHRQYEAIRGSQNAGGIDYEIFLVRGIPKTPKWTGFVEPYVEIGRLNGLANVTNSLIIFLRIDTPDGPRIFAISEGFGFHIIDRDKIEPNFGLKTTLNSIDSKKIKSMDVKSLGVQTLQRKEASNLATDFNEFGFQFDADILRVILGNCIDQGLGTKIGGSDSLTITTDVSFLDLANKCQQLYERYKQTTYRQDFAFIDYIQYEKDSTIVAVLDDCLVDSINRRITDLKISIAYPDQIDYDRCAYFSISGWGEIVEKTDLDLREIYQFIDDNAINGCIENIDSIKKKMRIIGLDSSGQPVSQSEPVYEYLTFETQLYGCTYILCNGKWYAVNQDYLRTVEQEIRQRIKPCTVSLLSWPINPQRQRYEEGFYNSLYSQEPDYLYLDKELFRFDGSSSSIEVADLFYEPGKKLFCVKKLNRSSTLSHLFSQATVSASLFKDMDSYKLKFLDQVKRRWPDLEMVPPAQYLQNLTFVYAIGSSRAGEIVDILPIFSKINLLKHARILNRFGYDVEIAKIDIV